MDGDYALKSEKGLDVALSQCATVSSGRIADVLETEGCALFTLGLLLVSSPL